MRLNQVDLNLFVVFDAVYTERNLTRAAELLSITQPAVSNALGRLRQSLNDQLFVRTPQGMKPTPVAENIIGPVRQALQLLNTSVQEGDIFDPGSAQKTFNFSMNDVAESWLLPPLLEHLQPVAPGISLTSYDVGRDNVVSEMAAGKLDFAIDAPLINDPNLCHIPLRGEPHVCLVRPDHPDVGDSLSLEQYLALGHILVSSRRTGLGQVDVALNRLGKQRRIQLRVRHYLVGPEVVRRTNLALTMPLRFAQESDLKVLELPFELPTQDWWLYWHKSADQDQANRWMRETLLGVLQG